MKKKPPLENLPVATAGEVVEAEESKSADIGTFENLSIAEIAKGIGYDGSLAVEVIEDRIRFYQHRTIEAALETGKFLILLKAITDHGDFKGRIASLGFTYRTASRFMHAAARVAKSPAAALLAKQAKNTSAFLELLTLEDDEIQDVLELDDLDRMPASQLRTLARKLREEKATLNVRLDTAETRAERLLRGAAAADPDLPRETVIARAYCMGAQKAAEIKLEGLLKNFAQEAEAGTEDARLRLEQEWIAANIIAARAIAVMDRMQEIAPFELPPRIMGQHTMTAAEAERWLIDARQIEIAEAVETDALSAPAPEKRRGRPRKEAKG